MRNIVKFVVFMTVSFSTVVYGSDYEKFAKLSKSVRDETGINFQCVQNVRHSRCISILKELMKDKATLRRLRSDIPIFNVKIGSSTTTAGGDGISVPYDKSPKNILNFLMAEHPISNSTCLAPKIGEGSGMVYTCQGACCGFANSCFVVPGCGGDGPVDGVETTINKFIQLGTGQSRNSVSEMSEGAE